LAVLVQQERNKAFFGLKTHQISVLLALHMAYKSSFTHTSDIKGFVTNSTARFALARSIRCYPVFVLLLLYPTYKEYTLTHPTERFVVDHSQ
jgi:hypothetical protein